MTFKPRNIRVLQSFSFFPKQELMASTKLRVQRYVTGKPDVSFNQCLRQEGPLFFLGEVISQVSTVIFIAGD